MIVGLRGFVCNILSLEWSPDVVLSFEVGDLGRLCLSVDLFDNCLRACGALCRRIYPCSFVRPPRFSTILNGVNGLCRCFFIVV